MCSVTVQYAVCTCLLYQFGEYSMFCVQYARVYWPVYTNMLDRTESKVLLWKTFDH